MLRRCSLLLVVLTATTLPSGGCRSCSDCHDYDPPVMGCEGCGYGQRAGSVCGFGGCSSCGCDSCGGGETQGGYEEQYMPYEGDAGSPQPSEQPAEEGVGT